MYLDFRSFTDGGAQMDRAMVRMNNPADDGESKSCSVLLVCDKGTEDVLLLVSRDSAAVVFYGDHQALVMGKSL